MLKDFIQVDAFTNRPFFGNPAAVVFDADDISAELMQRIAREMNLSETVFILQPTTTEADYRVRIFTPQNELPFAGHPTIAAAHSILTRFTEKADAHLLRQECGIGIVPIEVNQTASGGRLLRMTQGKPSYTEIVVTKETVAKMLGCVVSDFADTPFQVVSTGVPWLIVELAQSEAISTLSPDHALIAQECRALNAVGVTVFTECRNYAQARIRVRTFAPGEGVPEDPVCGSGNGSVAAFIALHKHGKELTGAYLAEQGVEINRDGSIYVNWERDGNSFIIKIGGEAAIAAFGQIQLPMSRQ